MKKLIAALLCVLCLIGCLPVVGMAADDFAASLAAFPDSYKASLTQLHKAHPNWQFKKVSVGKNFSECVNAEHNCKLQECTVLVSSPTDSKACQSNCKNAQYHYISDGTRCASYDFIAECMDPTNFLRESLIFQFEYLNAKSYYTKAKLETALDAAYSFMHNKTCKVSGKTYYYSQIILDACKANNVDALFIISRITNEVGALYPVKLAKGYPYNGKTVYNFFSIGAYPTAGASAPENGAKTAYAMGWTNPKAALEGGIKFIAQNYTKAGQYTNYFQKYQVNPESKYAFYTHQYMQGVEAIISESSYTYNSYNKLDILDNARTFYIPVYNNLEKVTYEAQDLSFQNAALSDSYAYVNAQVSSSLAVRSAPNTVNSTVYCRITRGTLLKLSGTSGNWYKASVLNGEYKGKSGYVHSDYVSKAQELSVTQGKTLTLKPKLRTSSCSYSVAADKGAVTITKGVASGVKIGATLFKAKSSAGNVSYLEIRCVGQIKAPVFTVALQKNKSAKITWSAVKDASCYRVYAYNASKKQYTRLAQTAALSYTASGLKDGTTYTYLVRAFDINGDGSQYTAASNKSLLTRPGKPTVKLLAGTTAVKLSWNKVTGAQKYAVWRYDKATDKYTRIANTTALSYKATGLKANTAYTFLVRANNASGWSDYTKANNQSITTAPVAPVLKATGGEKAVTLTWNSCKGASYYRVYAYNAATDSYKTLLKQTARSCKVSALAPGTEYTYLVRAFRAANAASSYTAKDRVSVITLAAKPTVKARATDTAVTLEWKKVKGADSYGIWQYDTQSGTYTKLLNTRNLSETIADLQPGTTYTFLVRSRNASGWSKYTKQDNISVKTK